jgi:hypothetical protein
MVLYFLENPFLNYSYLDINKRISSNEKCFFQKADSFNSYEEAEANKFGPATSVQEFVVDEYIKQQFNIAFNEEEVLDIIFNKHKQVAYILQQVSIRGIQSIDEIIKEIRLLYRFKSYDEAYTHVLENTDYNRDWEYDGREKLTCGCLYFRYKEDF